MKLGEGLTNLQMDLPENDSWHSFKVAAERDCDFMGALSKPAVPPSSKIMKAVGVILYSSDTQ